MQSIYHSIKSAPGENHLGPDPTVDNILYVVPTVRVYQYLINWRWWKK